MLRIVLIPHVDPPAQLPRLATLEIESSSLEHEVTLSYLTPPHPTQAQPLPTHVTTPHPTHDPETSTSAMPADPADPSALLLRGVEAIYLTTWSGEKSDRHDPRSAYVELFWLATLGPSTTWFLRHCADQLDTTNAAVVHLDELAARLGIGHNGGANSPMARSVVRACRFGAARPGGPGTLEVRRFLPSLRPGQLRRLPESLQRRHEDFVADENCYGDLGRQRTRARRLALSLIECGDGYDAIELQLGRWRYHPSVAAEAVRWAWSCHHGSGPTNAA